MAARFAAAVRQFSTSVRHGQLVTAPIKVFGLEGRYAHALYSAASKEKQLDAVEKEMKGFQDLLVKDPKLSDFLNDPSVSIQDKNAGIQSVLSKGKASNITINFFGALADNRRLNKANGIIKAFNTIMSAHRGEVNCTITSAKALDAKQMKELNAALLGFVEKGQTIQLETKVDPSIIGGLIVNIGEKYVDMSIATKVRTYSKLISDPV